MNKKLEEGTESFKQFVLDEYNQLNVEYKKLQQEVGLLTELKFTQQRRYNELQTKHQDLTLLCLKRTQEVEKLTQSKELNSITNFGKIELLERKLKHTEASHTDVCMKNVQLRTQNDHLIKKNFELIKEYTKQIDDLKHVNANLSRSNDKHIAINGKLIEALSKLGYRVEILPVKKSVVELIADKDVSSLKELVSKKYHVKEVKPEANKTKFDPEFLRNLLVNEFGKDFQVFEIDGDKIHDLFAGVKSDARRGSKVKDGIKGSPVRDEKGRYSKK